MKDKYNGPRALKIGIKIKGITVVKKIIATIRIFWKGTYCFLITLANHIPIDIAKAPIKSATTTGLIPSQIAPAPNAPAPIVQRGQCAITFFDKKIIKGITVNNKKNLVGKIIDVEGDAISIEEKDGKEIIKVNYEDISKANLMFEF